MSGEKPSFNQSLQKTVMMSQSKISNGFLNNELLKNIEILEEENSQLKLALNDLQEDLKDKENSIDESQKIIMKLEDEYSKLIKELQNIEQINNKLTNENEINKKEIENAKKSNNLISKLQNKNNELNNEINLLKKENVALKSKININNTSKSKNEKELKNKEVAMNNLKQKSDNLEIMIKEKDKTINELNKKINELNKVVSSQKEELKLMMDFSKNINKENKTNISEITKQAVQTIKLFYNDMSKNYSNKINDNAYRIEFKDSNANIVQEFENYFKSNKVTFLLDDAVNSMMYIPKNLKSISKEFIMDMNLKTELIKSELYSSILRENQIVKFLEEIFDKFNLKDTEIIKTICSKTIDSKNNLNKILKENNNLKKKYKLLEEKNKNYELFIIRLKNDFKNNMKKLKDKNINVINNINSKIEFIQKNSMLVEEKAQKDYNKYSEEIFNLKNENLKLNKNLEEYKKLIDTQKENEKLYKSLEEEKNILNNKYSNIINNRNFFNNNIIKVDSVISLKYISSNYKFKKINANMNKNRKNINYNKFSNLNTEGNKNNNYNKKKREIWSLKEEVNKVKNEISNIMMNSINPNERYSTIQNEDDIENNDIYSKSCINNNNLKNKSKNNPNKLNSLEKLLKNEKNKNINLEKENNELKKHINTLNMNLTQTYNNINSTNNTEALMNNNIFTPNFFIKMFYDINQKIFSSSELKKYYKIYDTNDLNGILDIFLETCECLKNQLYESYFEIDSPNSDYEDNYFGSKNLAIDNSYRLVNEKIIKLKKLEFDFINLSEFVKNYLVSQEIIVKIIFSSDDVIHFEPIERLFNMFEDCLNFKIDDMNDNVIFYRKLLIRIFKNQKNCLGLSLESISKE